MKREEYRKMVNDSRMKEVAKFENQNGTILISEGYYTPSEYSRFRGIDVKDFPLGVYRTMWCVERGDEDFPRDVFFAPDHDMHIPISLRQQARINAARKDAEGWIKGNVEVGRYA